MKFFFLFSFLLCLPVHLIFPSLIQKLDLITEIEGTLLETIKSNPDLSDFYELISSRPALEAALSLPKANLTVIAPANGAFDKVEDSDHLTEILLYHIVNNVILLKDMNGLLESGLHLDSLGGDNQKIVAKLDKEVSLNGHVKIEHGNIIASNGIIHTTTKILMPPPNLVWMSIHSIKQYGLFVLALKRTNLDQLLKNAFHTTVFAPQNEAFKALGLKRLAHLFSPSGNADLVLLVLNHISPFLVYSPDILCHENMVLPTLGVPVRITSDDGDIVLNGESTVVSKDLIASNGVIHGLDAVLGSFRNVAESLEVGDYSKEDWYQLLF